MTDEYPSFPLDTTQFKEFLTSKGVTNPDKYVFLKELILSDEPLKGDELEISAAKGDIIAVTVLLEMTNLDYYMAVIKASLKGHFEGGVLDPRPHQR